MSLRDGVTFVAGGAIAPSRFVQLSSANDYTVVQPSVANSECLGISQVGTKNPPGTTGASTNAATADNDPIQVFVPGDVAIIELGTGGAVRGQWLTTDTVGRGVGTSTVGHWCSAKALQSGAIGEFIEVLVTSPTRLS